MVYLTQKQQSGWTALVNRTHEKQSRVTIFINRTQEQQYRLTINNSWIDFCYTPLGRLDAETSLHIFHSAQFSPCVGTYDRWSLRRCLAYHRLDTHTHVYLQCIGDTHYCKRLSYILLLTNYLWHSQIPSPLVCDIWGQRIQLNNHHGSAFSNEKHYM